MKAPIFLGLWLLAGALLSHGLLAESESKPLSEQEVMQSIERGIVLPGLAAKQVLLARQILNQANATGEQTCNALLLLGKIKSAEAIAALVDNVDFHWDGQPAYPAREQLWWIGEAAVQPLIEKIASSKDAGERRSGVKTVMKIKGKDIQAFVDANFSKWPFSVQNAFDVYSSNP
jgi:hypothetical protein